MRHIHDGAPNYTTLDEDARQLQHDVELARVHEHFGADADRMVDLARQLVDEIEAKRPGFKAYLEATGAGNNRFVVAQFALQAQRLYDHHG